MVEGAANESELLVEIPTKGLVLTLEGTTDDALLEELPNMAAELEPWTDVATGATEGEDEALELMAGNDVPELEGGSAAPPADVDETAGPALVATVDDAAALPELGRVDDAAAFDMVDAPNGDEAAFELT